MEGKRNGASPFPLAATTDAVREATQRLESAQAQGQGYGMGQGATAGSISVGHEGGQVLIVFDKPVGYAGLPPEAAIELAMQLVRNAMRAGFPHVVELVVSTPEEPAATPEGQG